MKDYTTCLHGGYTPKNSEPRVLPIVQSTTYVFDSSEDIAQVFDDPTKALIYSRFENPTTMAVEDKIAQLEGGVAAMCTSSGQAATLLSILNLCGAGDSFVSTNKIYGGTANLFSFTLRKLGIECIYVDPDEDDDVILSHFKENTKLFFGETLANPALEVLDIRRFARLSHEKGVPLILDNTFATPILCKPIEHGADIVIHSTTKYMDGHAVQCGGVIVDSGNFDWANGKFPELVEPDPSYHGVSYVKQYGKLAFILKARMQLMRDFGCYPAAHSSFLLNLGLETLPLRMEKHCENALQVARFLNESPKIKKVTYPMLECDRSYHLCQEYLKGGSGVVTIEVNGGRKKAQQFMDNLKLISKQVHVADIRSCILHPASTTHRQLTDDQLVKAGITPDLVRISVGLEDIDDIIKDIKQALEVL